MLKVFPKLFSILLILFLLAVTTGTVFAAPRMANVTCSGNGCNGQDPTATGCANTATTPLSAPVKDGTLTLGTVYLRWSTACSTNWTKFVSNVGNIPTLGIIERLNGPDGPYISYCIPTNCGYSNPTTGVYTDMVYAPNEPARASAYVQYNGNTYSGCVANPPWSC